MAKLIFFISIFFIFYAYFGYPISMAIIGLFRNRKVRKASVHRNISFIIAAFNEENRIVDKIENTLGLNYPADNLEIIVASDGSTDKTNEYVESFKDRGVVLLSFAERRGKESAQRDAVAHSKGEILVFSDVSTKLDQNGLAEIISNFNDPSVGCVSSIDKIINSQGQTGGEGFYVKYEMWLRKIESRTNSIVGLSGSFFAARREVCNDFSGEMQSDFRTLLNSIKLGKRGVIDPRSIGYYLDINDTRKEFNRKVRTVIRGLNVFFNHLHLLNVRRFGLFSYQLFCHKLLRWMVPFLLFFALLANIALAVEDFQYLLILLMQFVFYGLAVYGSQKKADRLHVALKIPVYFVSVNLGIALAWVKFLLGEKMVSWKPTSR